MFCSGKVFELLSGLVVLAVFHDSPSTRFFLLLTTGQTWDPPPLNSLSSIGKMSRNNKHIPFVSKSSGNSRSLCYMTHRTTAIISSGISGPKIALSKNRLQFVLHFCIHVIFG